MLSINEIQNIIKEPGEKYKITSVEDYKDQLLAYLKRENADLRSDKELLKRIIEVKL